MIQAIRRQESNQDLIALFFLFQQRLNSGYFYTSPYGATSSPVGFTQTTSFQSYLETLNSNDDSVIAMDTFTSPVVPQVQLPHSQPQQLHQSQSQLLGKKTADDSATVASAQTATSDKSATSGVSTPQSKQPCSSNSQTELAEQVRSFFRNHIFRGRSNVWSLILFLFPATKWQGMKLYPLVSVDPSTPLLTSNVSISSQISFRF